MKTIPPRKTTTKRQKKDHGALKQEKTAEMPKEMLGFKKASTCKASTDGKKSAAKIAQPKTSVAKKAQTEASYEVTI